MFRRGLSPGVTSGAVSEYPGLWRESRESKNAATPIRAARPSRQLASRMAGRWQAGRLADRRCGGRRQAPQEPRRSHRAVVADGREPAAAVLGPGPAAAGRPAEAACGPAAEAIAAGGA